MDGHCDRRGSGRPRFKLRPAPATEDREAFVLNIDAGRAHEPADAAVTGDVVAGRLHDLQVRMAPLRDAACEAGRKIEHDETYCSLE